ncbi:4-galactosyl-N-acetylglucosaminide 3-alpha-L-fucosyltransferase FUT6-like [Patiria miniata]|uniref:Fucosyltransferase n=1 Tax=Patiria miniata TaxID=46514 RepID=A0A913ZIV7_PATMI|nr:4-galactosyl-N-acetylglucosaminide 3-alpha-L-fucosyltransferase FUT6-like [Patiria miniata]
MAAYRLKLRLLTVVLFAIAALVSYSALQQSSRLFRQLEVDSLEEFPGQPHPRDVKPTDHKKRGIPVVDKGKSNEKPGDGPQFERNHPGNVSGAVQPKCSATVTILVPSMRPFKAWREYEHLMSEFSHHSTQLGDANLRSLHLQCPSQRCDVDIRVTTDEEYLNTSDAVIVNMFPNALKDNLLDFLSHLRQILHPKTHWFFYGVESPQMMTYWDPNIAEIQYHHSITYHSEADIRLPYGRYLPNRRSDQRSSTTTRDWSANKTALIAWMASNCDNTFWPRYEFVIELKKHVPVDMYGGCGTLTCLPAMSEKCTNLVAGYKFYLSLENAECDEYITEKVWSNALLQGAVPVVYGGRKEAYQQILPPKSFIHIGDFDSVQHLASYLQILDQNDNMYNMYHAWRERGSVQAVYPPLDPQLFCEVVPFVLTPPPAFRTVKNSGYFKACKSRTGTFVDKDSLKSFVAWE